MDDIDSSYAACFKQIVTRVVDGDNEGEIVVTFIDGSSLTLAPIPLAEEVN